MERRYALRDDQWERIKDLLPGRKGSVGVTANDHRLFVEVVIYRYRTGIPWRDLPTRFGNWNNVARHYWRWSQKGIWQKVFAQLAGDVDNEYGQRDSTIVRAHQHASGAKGGIECIGRSKGGLSTKIHATCDALGNPLGFHLRAGQAHDLQVGDALLPE